MHVPRLSVFRSNFSMFLRIFMTLSSSFSLIVTFTDIFLGIPSIPLSSLQSAPAQSGKDYPYPGSNVQVLVDEKSVAKRELSIFFAAREEDHKYATISVKPISKAGSFCMNSV